MLLLTFEGGETELERRIKAAMLCHKVSDADIAGRLFVKTVTRSHLKCAVTKPGDYREGPLLAMLRAAIRQRRIDAVILDPLIKRHAMNEKGNTAMDFVMDLLADLAVEFDVAMDVPHHTAKGEAHAGNADAGWGASAIKDGGRLVCTQTPDVSG